MTPQSSRYVGINKMNPESALDVSGNGSMSGNFGINKPRYVLSMLMGTGK